MSRSSTSSSDPSRTGALPDGTIALPAGPHHRATPVLRVFALGVFGAALLGTAIVDQVWPAPRPIPIGREKVIDDQRRAKVRWKDGSRMALLEDDLKLTSRVRATARPLYTRTLYDLFDEVGSEHVVAGKDGWLFLRNRAGINMPDSVELTLERSAIYFAALHRRLANLGLRSVSAPLPRKEVVERANAPAWLDVHEQVDLELVERWRARGIETIDLMPMFEHPPQGEPVYYRAGTHWTRTAQMHAAEEIARQAGVWVEPSQRSTEIEPTSVKPADFDMLTRIGLSEEDAVARAGTTQSPLHVVVQRDAMRLNCDNQLPMPAMAITGTSFTGAWGVPCYLRHFTDQAWWCLALGGSDGISPLDAFLREQPQWPSTLVIETPNHILLDRAYSFSIGSLLGHHPPRTALTPLPLRVPIEAPYDSVGGELSSNTARIIQLSPALFASSGDGALELALTGELSGGEAEVVVLVRGVTVNAHWTPGQTRLVVPILAADTSAAAVHVVARAVGGKARLSLSRAELVVAGDLTRAVEFDPSAPRTANGAWTLELSARPAPALPAHAALLIALAGDATALARTLELHAHAQGRPDPLSWRFDALQHNGAIVVNLGALRGATLTRVTLTGVGPTPRLGEARVIAPR